MRFAYLAVDARESPSGLRRLRRGRRPPDRSRRKTRSGSLFVARLAARVTEVPTRRSGRPSALRASPQPPLPLQIALGASRTRRTNFFPSSSPTRGGRRRNASTAAGVAGRLARIRLCGRPSPPAAPRRRAARREATSQRARGSARRSITRSPDPPAAGATAGSSGRGPWRS